MIRALMSKVYTKQEQMASGSTEMEIVRKNQKDMLKIKNVVTENEKK